VQQWDTTGNVVVLWHGTVDDDKKEVRSSNRCGGGCGWCSTIMLFKLKWKYRARLHLHRQLLLCRWRDPSLKQSWVTKGINR